MSERIPPLKGEKREIYNDYMKATEYVKVYVDVIVMMRADASIIPMAIVWEGKRYHIDKLDGPYFERPDHVGCNPCVKFNCYINGQKKELFSERGPQRWFIEKLQMRY